jgi:hypothetical protein
MPKQFTAKAFVSSMSSGGDGQTNVSFTADYADGANKEWAKYTPSFSVSMVVLDEVAEGLKFGDKCDVLFTFPDKEE